MDGRELEIPEHGRLIDEETVAFAAALIDRSGTAGQAEAALARPTGRRRALPVRAVLAALLILAMDDRPLHLTLVTDLLFRRLSGASRRLLGVSGAAPAGRRGFLAAYRRVRYCYHAICSTADPSPLPKNRRLTGQELAAAARPMTTQQAQAARTRLEKLINALTEASVTVLTGTECQAFDGSTGLDATAVPLFSRGPSRRAGLCASDPDGGWYVREGDHRDTEDHAGRKRTKIAWALEATIATMAPAPRSDSRHPNLALGLALTRPGHDPGGTGTRVLASVTSRGHPAGFPGAGRAYSAAMPGRFRLPARALGYHLVMDYRAGQLGIQANSGGALLAEGTWSCPAMPRPLITATADHRAGTITKDLYAARIASRAPYRLKRKDGPDHDGYQRLSCPAAGSHPGIICPLRETSLTPRDGRAKILDPPADPPRICRQTAITIAPGTGARHRQDLAFGSGTWARRYATLRNTIEGLNGFVKDPAHEALSQPARRRVRGIAACALFSALLLMAANLRKIRAWRAQAANSKASSSSRRARRRRTSLRDHLPDG